MSKEIQNFKAFPPQYWQARISGTDFESAIRYAEREGLRRGGGYQFCAARESRQPTMLGWRRDIARCSAWRIRAADRQCKHCRCVQRVARP